MHFSASTARLATVITTSENRNFKKEEEGKLYIDLLYIVKGTYGRNGFLDGLRDVRKEGHSSFKDSKAFFRRRRGMDVVRSASVAQLEEAHA